MPESNTAGQVAALVPLLSEAADINKAFKDYHANVGNAISIKANTANPTFTGSVSAPNLNATITVTAPTITATNTHINVHTVTIIGQASSAVKGARYYPNSNVTPYNTNTADVNQTRILVSQYSPNVNTLVAGDVWISWAV
jgi:hypothetical protein